ncbi:uncharacterized protein F4817DRAFT_323286 [Daldinia loculata]|uniref:uncharacterized protein n=1 Tax=Daldinia loculata TaxID=103429 RepID=UPI0020C50EA0|nr:uncharacterized protein F4817DRAFT_323286 [Daldinia loculata]KAI1651687.1 hypothetical protein F4817DRAFT_323286 [Daldinia loculata]
MADQRVYTPSGSRGAVRRHFRSSSQSQSHSPTHNSLRPSDDLLSQLTPLAAVDALQSPTGALKQCMDRASASEQAFAMRTATASQKIREWYDELSSWPWPKDSSSAGFKMPSGKRKDPSDPKTPGDDSNDELAESGLLFDGGYLGSLPAADVDRYEKRVERIRRDLDELDLEEIKNQVLHNHIMPLSRPGTPLFEGDRSLTSTLMFSKMEDLTAVVTAITIQALPCLSRLSRLLNMWAVRFVVLRKVPSLHFMMADAKMALRSGWSAIESAESGPASSTGHDNLKKKPRRLTRNEFEIIKGVIQKKIMKPGQVLDSMLDSLEGSTDTLPDEWLDRMEAIEKDYASWETTAERKVRENETPGSFKGSPAHGSRMGPETPRPKIKVHGPSPTRLEESDVSQFASPPMPFDPSPAIRPGRRPSLPNPEPSRRRSTISSRKDGGVRLLTEERSKIIRRSASQTFDPTRHVTSRRDIDSGSMIRGQSFSYDGSHERRPPKIATAKSTGALPNTARLPQGRQPRGQAQDKFKNRQGAGSSQTNPVLGEVNRNIIRSHSQEPNKPNATIGGGATLLDEDDLEFLEPSVLEAVDEEREEPDLPPARFEERKGSMGSVASTVIHGSPSGGVFLGHSDNGSFREGSMEPDLPRLPDPDEPFSSDGMSPPSSPPLRYKTRSTSVTFKDVPEVAHLPQFSSTPPRSPIEPSGIIDGDGSFEYDSQSGSPGRTSTFSSLSEDEHLQQQISDILQSIPAKIRLKRTPGVNLNPPDFQYPSRPKPKTSDGTRRSNSGLSSRGETPSFSRSGTPSFMLTPAREPRPRSKSSQGIRVYHLSRSTGEPPLKLLVRSVGENGERVMVRIGGGWADLGEYLREYAIHHGSRSRGESKVDIKDLPTAPPATGSSPASRPSSSMGSPVSPLAIRKTRRSVGSEGAPLKFPNTPFASLPNDAETPASEISNRSRSSSHMEWDEEDSALGLAGPKGRRVDMSDESRAWVESVKEKVRIASNDRVPPPEQRIDTKFGEISKVGGTKRLFRKH